MRLNEFRYWSPMLGCDVVRISLGGPKGEYHATIKDEDGPAYRLKRKEAVEKLQLAVERDLEPGEVRWR